MGHRTIGAPTGDLASRDMPAAASIAPTPTRARSGWLVARGVGAIAVLTAGIVHLQLWMGTYGAIPTIGPLFLLHVVAAMVVAAALLAPLEHLTGRHAGAAVAIATVGGIALAMTTVTLEYISERRPVFGFQEPGYDPSAIATQRNAELIATVALTASLVGRFARRGPARRW
jgi:hypothetical protein